MKKSFSCLLIPNSYSQFSTPSMKMFKTLREDWVFVIPTTVIWLISIGVSLLEYSARGLSYCLNAVSIAGIILFVIGVAIRMVGKMTLGRFYSYGLVIKRDHKLVTHGIYRYVRHPIMLAAIIYSVAIPLSLMSMTGSVIMLGLIPFIVYRIGIEESMLLDRFGDEYRDYMKRTKRMIPYIY